MSNAPLLILLHGLGDSSEFISNFFHIQGPASDKGVILIIPNGLKWTRPQWTTLLECTGRLL